MITETTCADVVACLYEGATNLDNRRIPHSLPNTDLYRRLLGLYSLPILDDTLRWLELGNFVGREGFGLPVQGLPFAYTLTEKGMAYAKSRVLPPADRALLYVDDPYEVFIARQFSTEDAPLFATLSSALQDVGLSVSDGKVDGLDAFRGEIIRKIRRARLFVCLLTHREALQNGEFASSVWLYQETGAAIALGKKPLLLVENGMHAHYAGELQKTYEYVPFERNGFSLVLPEVVRRLQGDLNVNNIPLPTARAG